jgi:hypothetical protein
MRLRHSLCACFFALGHGLFGFAPGKYDRRFLLFPRASGRLPVSLEIPRLISGYSI